MASSANRKYLEMGASMQRFNNTMAQLWFYEMKLNLSTVASTFCLFLFYIVAIPLFLGFSPELLCYFHLGVIWMCVLYAFLPERLFQLDLEDGTLELYCLSSCPIQSIFTCKLVGNWCLKIGGILLSIPFFSIVYQFELSNMIYFTMILGSFTLTIICALHSSLTLGLKTHSWNSLQHFTTLPTLLPLILLCTSIQTVPEMHFLLLLAYLSLLLWVYCTFISIPLYSVLSD